MKTRSKPEYGTLFRNDEKLKRESSLVLAIAKKTIRIIETETINRE
tara:strand:- start:196 stop:333 length:138 start_codon:yes stop_codon:yes gene_type:complete